MIHSTKKIWLFMQFLISISLAFFSAAVFAFQVECNSELKLHCREDSKQMPLLACIQKISKLSPACQDGLKKLTQEKGDCALDIAKFCPERNSFSLMFTADCLQKKNSFITAACSKAVETFFTDRTKEIDRIRNAVLPLCKAEFIKHCPKDLNPNGLPVSMQCFRSSHKAGKFTDKQCLAAIDELHALWREERKARESQKNVKP